MIVSKVIATFGDKLKIIAKRMMTDEELCKLLYFSDNPLEQENVEDKNKNILNKHIIVNTEVPYDSDKGSYILITMNNIDPNLTNTEVLDVEIFVDIICPTDDWNYSGPSLRPFTIMKKVIETFENIDLEGVGKLKFEGASLAVAANSMSGYTVRFTNYSLGT